MGARKSIPMISCSGTFEENFCFEESPASLKKSTTFHLNTNKCLTKASIQRRLLTATEKSYGSLKMSFKQRSPLRYNDILISQQRHLQDRPPDGVTQSPIVYSTIGGNKNHSISVPSEECSKDKLNEKFSREKPPLKEPK